MKYFFIIHLLFPLLLFSQQLKNEAIPVVSGGYKIIGEVKSDSTIYTVLLADSSSFILVDSTGVLSKINTRGDTLWQNEVFGTIDKNVEIYNNQLILSTKEGDLFTFDLTNGDQLISIGFDDTISAGPVLFNSNLESNSTKIKNSVLMAFENGLLTAYDINTLVEIWNFDENHSRVISDLTVVKNKAVFATANGFFYCIDLKKGWLIWKWKFPETIKPPFLFSNIISDDKAIYFVSSDKKMYKVDLLLGKIVWRAKKKFGPGKISFVNKKNIFANGLRNSILIVNKNNGKVRKSVKFPSKDFAISNHILNFGNMLIFKSVNNILYEFKNFKFYKITGNSNMQINRLLKLENNKLAVIFRSGLIYILEKL